MGTKHWGEIEPTRPTAIPDVSADIERSMGQFCLAEYISERERNQNGTEHIVLAPMDPLMLYAISLHKYANDTTEMIRNAELAVESNVLPPKDAVKSIPPKPKIPRKHVKNCLNYIPKDFTSFTEGKEMRYLEISNVVARKMLCKCIATMFAHVGFENTHNSILLILTDVLEMYMKKVCERFKTAREEEIDDGLGGFPSFPEKVLTEFGMGGLRGLHDYYQNRVVNYVDVLYRRCRDLNAYYETLLTPKSLPPTDNVNKVAMIVEEDVVEVQMRPGLEGEVGMSSLETGFQLLHSLEDPSLWEESEELNVAADTSMVSTSEAEASATVPSFPKKKRTK